MTLWTQLIEKIQGLLSAFEDDSASSCCLSSGQLNDEASDEASIAMQDVNCPDDTVEQLTSCSTSRVSPGEDIPTSVQKMLQLQPLKSNADCHFQKKYNYVNKKFIVWKETRKDETNVELVDKEACKEPTANDPYAFVGTQTTPASEARDWRHAAVELDLFEEMTELQQRVVDINSKHARAQHKCRYQERLQEKGLKQLAEDIADAETYSLVISQKCIAESQSKQQSMEVIDADVNEAARVCHDVTVNETTSQTSVIAYECDDSETVSEVETGVDICMLDKPSADTDLVNNRVSAENDEQAVKDVRQRAGEKRGCASDGALSGSDICVRLNVETGQLHSAPVSDICSATDNSEIPETSLSRSTDICDTMCHVQASQNMLCAVNTTMTVSEVAVEVSRDCMSHADISTASNVSNSELNDTQQSIAVTVAAGVSPQNTLHYSVCDHHITAVSVYSQQCLPSISVETFDRINVKRPHKRRRKAQQKKHKNESIHYAGSRSRRMKSLIASDVEDDSSG